MSTKIIFLLSISFLLSGCSHTIIKEVPVPTPVKCQIKIRSRPIHEYISPEYLRDLLIYTEELERDLRFCVDGEIEK